MTIHGILGKKIGMTQIFRDDGVVDSVTAIHVGPCFVTQIKTIEKDGYEAVQIGFDESKKLNKPRAGHLANTAGTTTKIRYLREVKADSLEDIEVGQKFDVGIFEAGQKIHVAGLSKGRGFAGGVKRYNFRGGPKTHGQSDRHRAPGSIGAGTYPGHVLKGLKMAGHMGNASVTVKNLVVVQADLERNLLFVKGGVPGARNSLVMILRAGG
jgi:large subunit ribosomal protein L3